MKQKPILRNILSVFMIMLGTWSLQATHIVGGEMNYTCLGNNNFEIQLTVFRDCFYADPRAFFDDPAYIGVFNSNNQRVRQLAFPLLTNDTIPAILSDSCLFVPNDVCVHTTTYRGIVNLPLIEGGYQLAYERCCRNETIMNILDPLNAGAVYNVFISEESLTECNNSAKFKDWPPIFVCVNEPIDWDHSAIDVDGDSLVYALCTPLSGGTQADPKPVPTNNPPFDQVVWNEPAFGLDNLLGGTPLAIDPQTGQLTGMPTVMGQFVVGVNVKEFRNGEMISVTRRDFQYNVGECGEVEAAIVAPQVQCEDLSVSFTNTSLNADAYLWSFNDPNNPGAFSTTEEPTFVYADTGTYTIRLISSTKTVCRDTSYHTVFLQRNSMKADFEVDVLDCLDNSTLNVSDLSIDSVSAPAFWDWQLKVDGELAATSNIQNPVFNIEAPASVELTLSVTSENGCVDGTTKSFSADLNDPGDDIESEILVCIGTETQLNPDYNPDLTYQWQLNPLFDDLSSPNPTVIANEDIDLQVIIRDENNACSISKTVQIRVAEIPAINAIPDQFILCEGESAQLNATEYPNLVFEWSGNGLDDPSSDTPIATPSETTTYTVNITDINQNNCGLSKQVEVVVNPNPDDVLASISNDAIICPGENLALNPSDAPNFDYNWFGADISDPSESNPIILPTTSGEYAVTVTNPVTGCTSSKTFNITAPEEIGLNITGDPNLCFGETRLFEANGRGDLTYSWINASGQVVSNQSSYNFNLDESNDFTLQVTNAFGCEESSTLNVVVSENPDAIINAISDDVVICFGEEVSLNPDANPNFDYTWSGVDIIDENAINPTFIPTTSDRYDVTVTNPLTRCQSSKNFVVTAPEEIGLEVTGDPNICFGETRLFAASGSGNLSYSWMNASGLEVSDQSEYNFDLEESGDYRLVVTNSFGCQESANLNIVVNENPDDIINGISDDVVVCFGEQISLNPDANPDFEYTWNGVDIIDENAINPTFIPTSSDRYDVTVTIPATGCASSKNFIITAPEEIGLEVTGDPNICIGETRLFEASGTGNLSYSWMHASGQEVSNQSNYNFDLEVSGDYTVIATNNFGCQETGNLNIVVNEVPDAIINAISEDVIVCFGEQIALNPDADPDYEYTWTGEDIIDPNAINPTFFPTISDRYDVTVTIPSTGCQSSKNFVVTAPEEIDLNVTGDPNICFGDTRRFEASGTGDLSYSWINTLGQEVSNQFGYNFVLEESEDFIVIATNSYGCQETANLNVVVNENPDAIVNAISGDVIVCFGEQVSLNTDANPNFEYQWTGSDIINENAINPTFFPTITDRYDVTVTNPSTGCQSTKNFVVTAPEEIGLEVNGDPNICFGNTRFFESAGNGLLTYSWKDSNGQELSDAAFINYDLNIDNDLTIVATNNFGCQESAMIAVRINDNPDNAIALVETEHIVCRDSRVALNSNGDPSFAYNWVGNEIIDPAGINPVIAPQVSGNYAVTITNPSTGCESTQIVRVTVPEDIELEVAGDRSLCHLEDGFFEASGTGVVLHRWISQDGAILSNSPVLNYDLNISNNITVEVANEFGCEETTILEVNVADRIDAVDNIPDSILVCENVPTSLSTNTNDQFQYLWSPSVYIDDNTSSAPIFSAIATTTYSVEIVDPVSGCMEMKNIKAVVPEAIDLQLSDDVTTCGDQNIQLTATSTIGETFSWVSETGASLGTTSTIQVNPRESNLYILEIADQFGCILVDSVRVNYTGIDARIEADAIETCDDEVQLMLSNVPVADQNAYTWGPEEAILSGANSSNPIVINDTNDPITFTVTITNEHRCIVVDQVVLRNRFDLDNLNVDGINACAEVGVQLNPDFNPAYDYTWSPAAMLDNPNTPNPTFIPTESQDFSVTITDDDGCSTIREVSVATVDLDEMVDISITNDTLLSGQTVQLEVTFDPDFTYQWIPPAGLDNSTINNPIASPTETTNYSVMVQNSQGCIATETVTLTVLSSECEEPYIFFPNAFTPNGDGINDVLRVRGNAITEVRYIIYDRWGEKMFEGNSVDDEWDGTYKGRKLPPDVFGYYLEAKCIFGGEFKKQGNVTILD